MAFCDHQAFDANTNTTEITLIGGKKMAKIQPCVLKFIRGKWLEPRNTATTTTTKNLFIFKSWLKFLKFCLVFMSE